VGRIDPLSLADYEAHGGSVRSAPGAAMDPAAIVAEVKESGLRGRGGAGFPTGIKWETVRTAPGPRKYIVCNADEGDSGTFADRMMMEGDPFVLIEGMVIAGLGVGAEQGYVYLRSEYPDAIEVMERAVEIARAAGILGDVLGSGRRFDMEIRVGAGAYVCGEETSLLNSLEGKRGVVRAKPPLPALEGFLGRPTVVNNVISLATVPVIFEKGAAHYAASAGPVARHDAVPDRGQREIRRAFRDGLRHVAGRSCRRYLRRHRLGPPGEGGAGRRAARAPISGGEVRHAFGYEEFDGKGGLIGHAGRGGLRRHRRHAQAGALRDGVLRHRKLRQMHALPDRRGAGRRDARPDRGGRSGGDSSCWSICATR
jgi:formate dehydrogenase iron-sulfur subunit